MTKTQRQMFERMATRYTEASTASRAAARATLVREGIRLADGRLAPEYGGGSTKAGKKTAHSTR